jgi:hypothetical protein
MKLKQTKKKDGAFQEKGTWKGGLQLFNGFCGVHHCSRVLQMSETG